MATLACLPACLPVTLLESSARSAPHTNWLCGVQRLLGWLVGWSFTNSSQATCVISQLVVREIGGVFAGTPHLWDRKQEQAIAQTLLHYTQQK